MLTAGWKAGIPVSADAATQRLAQAAQGAISSSRFEWAQASLARYHDVDRTYVGASVDGNGMRLVWASATQYCLQTGSGRDAERLVGPGGRVEHGACG
jgi:hypothetical protein